MKFLIIGNMNAIAYVETFAHIKNNELWLGTQYVKEFLDGNGEVKKFGNILWYTNLDHKKRHQPLDLYKHYSPEEYPKYDSYDAINVDKVCDIPLDYEGIMGVPITFLDKYCPSQFEIVGLDRYVEDNPHYGHRFHVNGKETYARILIKHV